MNLQQSLTRSLAKGSLWFVVIAALFLGMVWGTSFGFPTGPLADESNLGRPNATGSLPDLIARGECWTGGNSNVIPGHVWADGHLQGPEVAAQALDQLFGGREYGLNVAAFCK